MVDKEAIDCSITHLTEKLKQFLLCGLIEPLFCATDEGGGMEITMMTAKLFENGRSQAVRLPKECRFNGDEVAINKIGDMVRIDSCD